MNALCILNPTTDGKQVSGTCDLSSTPFTSGNTMIIAATDTLTVPAAAVPPLQISPHLPNLTKMTTDQEIGPRQSCLVTQGEDQ